RAEELRQLAGRGLLVTRELRGNGCQKSHQGKDGNFHFGCSWPLTCSVDGTPDAVLDGNAVLLRQRARRIVGGDRHAGEQRTFVSAEQSSELGQCCVVGDIEHLVEAAA